MTTDQKILEDLEQAINQFRAFRQNAIAGITVQKRFKPLVLNESWRSRVSAVRPVEVEEFPATYLGVPIYWVERQPEQVRIYGDHEALQNWLNYQQTGELKLVGPNDREAARIVGGYLVQNGRQNLLEPMFPPSDIHQRLGLVQAPDDYPILEQALAVNGYRIAPPDRYSFTAMVNTVIALEASKKRYLEQQQ